MIDFFLNSLMSSSVPYDPFVGSTQQHPQAQQTTGGPSKTQAIRSVSFQVVIFMIPMVDIV